MFKSTGSKSNFQIAMSWEHGNTNWVSSYMALGGVSKFQLLTFYLILKQGRC